MRTLHRHRDVSPRRHLSSTSCGLARTVRFGAFTITYMEHPSVRLDGDRAWGTDPDMLRLMIVVSGEVILSHPDISATLASRDSAVVLGTDPVTYSSEGPARVVTCDVPVEQSADFLPRFAPFVVGRADAAVPCALGALMLDLLRQEFEDVERLSPVARAQVVDVLRTLTSSAITTLAVGGASDWDVRRQRTAALRLINARYTDPDLSSALVAEHLGVSRRSLQRLFEGQGCSISQHIVQTRIRHAVARLKDPRLASATLSEIATLSGFTSAVSMRRAVHDATGLSPDPPSVILGAA